MAAAEKRDPVYQRLRVVRPAAVAAVLEDGETRELALGGSKGKWERVIAAARALDADGIECRNSDDAIIEIIPLHPEGLRRKRREEDDDDEPRGTELDALGPLLARSLTLCADFADRATQRQQDLLSSVCETAIQVMRASADRAERSERALDKVLRAHEKLLMQRVPEGSAEGFDATDMMAMMASMMAGGADPRMMLPGTAGPSGAKGNGAAGGDFITVPRAMIEKVKRYLDAHPEVNLDDLDDA